MVLDGLHFLCGDGKAKTISGACIRSSFRTDIIRGGYAATAVEYLKTGTRPPFPYSDVRLLPYLQHSFWFLPNVAACLSPNEPNPENAVKDLVSFLPVLAYDGANMTQIDAGGILDIAMAGTSG